MGEEVKVRVENLTKCFGDLRVLDVVELYEKLYGEGKLPKGDFTIHIDNEGQPTGVSLKTEKGEKSVPTDKMQILVIKNDKLIYESSNYNESDWWGY